MFLAQRVDVFIYRFPDSTADDGLKAYESLYFESPDADETSHDEVLPPLSSP